VPRAGNHRREQRADRFEFCSQVAKGIIGRFV